MRDYQSDTYGEKIAGVFDAGILAGGRLSEAAGDVATLPGCSPTAGRW
ncbi:hypothetical protein [Longispora albida]|nr:hypothetical protein [Longispora albida]